MPGATPLPRGPNRLTLYDARDLLTVPGCPVCRYAAEAGGDRYLAWFALEGHADPATVTRLCAASGMCPRHTRGTLGQPGAEQRLTALYRYLLPAALEQVLAGEPLPGACPACARDAAATEHAVDTLLDGLGEEHTRRRYAELGGLCLPHLRLAVTRARRRLATWLVRGAISQLTGTPPDASMLAGAADPDAAVRARLRAILPVSPLDPPSPAASRVQQSQSGLPGACCPVCLATATAERDFLAWPTGCQDGHAGAGAPGQRHRLCAPHLQDACADAAGSTGPAGSITQLLAWQAGRSRADLDGLLSSLTTHAAINWLSRKTRQRAAPPACPACRAGTAAADSEAERLREAVLSRPASLHGGHPPGICLRHVASLRATDQKAGDLATRQAVERTAVLREELEEAFRKQTWTSRHEARGTEMTTWRRAPALIDGAVYGGGPPVRWPWTQAWRVAKTT